MPSDSRQVILERIQRATGAEVALPKALAEWEQIGRAYTQGSAATVEELVHRLTDRLVDYDAHVYRAVEGDVREVIRKVLLERGNPQVLVESAFPKARIADGLAVTVDIGFDHAELDGFEGVMTGATVAIAQTGSLVLQHGAAQGRRAITLIPDYHLCVVRVADVVGTVPEAMARLVPTLPTTFVSGPSATADIEMTRIKGVHGPRFLDVVLVF